VLERGSAGALTAAAGPGIVARLVPGGPGRCLSHLSTPKGPLQFRRWTPASRMEPGVWKIPIPAEPIEVDPDVLFVPLVGFDPERYRLGNGGGYYDRTLAVP